MKESADGTTNLEPPAPRSKGWLMDSLESSAEYQRRLYEIQMRKAAQDARRDLIAKNVSITFFVVLMLACTYGVFMGCVEIWNAVVG